MKTKDARKLASEIIHDLDNAVAGDPRDPAARHSAAASAAILAARLLGGIAVNIARIAYALEGIEANTRPEEDEDEGPHSEV